MDGDTRADGSVTLGGRHVGQVRSSCGSHTGVSLTVSDRAVAPIASVTVMPSWGLMAMAAGGRLA
ncbi:hypothetical protein CKO40_23245 [Halochromatium glycolicum]|uniref:Uncharacterized protein n=1 Tax=Halochromatium glycolicum TaxID=85075 RepID=A0AAJ0U8M7_9GAMM|nr:hypothetical protein [Halochromatium glycolicum]